MRFADRAAILQDSPGRDPDSSPGRNADVAPGQPAPRPADSWPAWADEPAGWPVAPVPAAPGRRTFLGLLGAGAALLSVAGFGASRGPAAVVAPPAGPLERLYREMLAAVDEVESIMDREPSGPDRRSPEVAAFQRRYNRASDAADRLRHELMGRIAAAAGVELPARDETPDVCELRFKPLAAAREGRHAFLVVADDFYTCKRAPLFVEGVYPC